MCLGVIWRLLENPAYRIAPVGVTFDGRDLFAPAAARRGGAGVDPVEFGTAISDPVILRWPEPQLRDETVEGGIVVRIQGGGR